MLSLLLFLWPLTIAETAPPQAPPATITLEQAVSTVLAQSPQRQAAGALLDGARTAERFAGAWPNPAVEVRAENWTFASWPWLPSSEPGAMPGVDFFAVLAQPIELGGKRSSQRAIAASEREIAAAGLSQVERALAGETVRLYLDAVRSRELLKALVSNHEGLDTLLRAMTARVREGYAAEADLAKFQAESARVQTQMLRARVDLSRNLSLLGGILRLPAPLGADQLVEPAPRETPPGDAAELSKQAAERSPEVIAARARTARARGTWSLERARRVPDLTVAGGYKRTAGADTAVVGVMMAIPLFDTNKRAVATATGGRRAAELEEAAVEAQATVEARAIIDAARILGDRARRVDDDLLKPAEVVRTAARAAFREGASDILNLVDAERVYVDARREALQLKLDAIAAAIQARLVLGEEILR